MAGIYALTLPCQTCTYSAEPLESMYSQNGPFYIRMPSLQFISDMVVIAMWFVLFLAVICCIHIELLDSLL